ncbi:MAG: cysteine desulfurase [Paludibacteraceae bacterium]|nr:cysteine desulfurase [Paludibacteraceae bacterium]
MNRTDFPILTETVHGRPLVYLDNAATSQKPQAVLDAMTEAYAHWNSNIHRGVHHLSQLATQHHEEARRAVADFIGAGSPDEIIFTRGTTDSLNALAFCFGEAYVREGDEILVSAMEHHSNIVPWQMLCERKGAVLRPIPLRADLTLDMEAFRDMLNERTRLVSIAQVSNVLGIVNPVEEVIRLAHERDIPVCIDGAQSVPHMPVNVSRLDCDFLAFSGHKMYAPTGIGVLYGKRRWLEAMPPYQGGGEMVDHVRWSGTTYNVLPYKFEAGTPDFVGSYGLHCAIRYIQSLGWDTVTAHEHDLTAYCEQRLTAVPGLHVYAAGQPKEGVISFNLFAPAWGAGLSSRSQTAAARLIHPFDVGTLLDRQGVAVRTGHHCAQPLIDHLGVPGTVRVSFGLYNDRADVDALLAALDRARLMLT